MAKNTVKKNDVITKSVIRKTSLENPASPNAMSNPAYLRQSSALINEALKKGFDVLQLANGDIVTTGTRTIVNQYIWDNEKLRLAKAKNNVKAGQEEADRSEAQDEKIYADEAEDA